MVTNFKIFESRINKNPATWKGKPFWIGIVDLRDGEIIATWTYQKAKSCDFHHSFYMDEEYLEKIKGEEYGVFWFNKGGLETWDNFPKPDIYQKIYDQLD